jgi:hypothetical protein
MPSPSPYNLPELPDLWPLLAATLGIGALTGGNPMRTYRKTRNVAYRVARDMGNLGPWIETVLAVLSGSPEGVSQGGRKIVRRAVYKQVGRVFGRFAFGGGALGRGIARILGIR